MSNCDCQKTINKPTGDRLLLTTVAAIVAGVFFELRAVGVGQQSELLTPTSLVYLMSLPVFRSDDEKTYTIKWVALIERKHWRLYQRWTDHNCRNHQNVFRTLNAANVKLSKTYLDAMDIMKLVGKICGGVLVKDYAVYKNGSTSDKQKFNGPP